MKLIAGTPAAKGMVIGEIKVIERHNAGLNRVVRDPEKERMLFDAACLLAKDEIEYLVQNQHQDEQDIFEFQKAMLEDNALLTEVYNYISVGAGAAAAIERACRIFEKKMKNLEDEYFRQRADDIKDACQRIVDILDGHLSRSLVLEKAVILVAEDILPSDLMGIDRHNILGFITTQGSPQSHAVIIAKTLGVPAIVMAERSFDMQDNGKIVALDGTKGEIYLQPTNEIIQEFKGHILKETKRKKELELIKDVDCVTKDGIKVKLYANCNSVNDVELALKNGAEGVGLVRSEFLVTDNGKIPSEQEQYEFYKDILRAAKGKRVIVRTYDFGADKPLPSIIRYSEPNPALGLRGVRLCLERQDMFKTQIKSLLRAGQHGNLSVMIPMVSSKQEIDMVKEIWATAIKELEHTATPFNKEINLGAMIETPAAAMLSDEISKEVDFLSIGTNDLTQYTHAADRSNPLVGKYYPVYSRAVEKLIINVLESAKLQKIPVCVCGEAAGNEKYLKSLIATGVTAISVTPPILAEVKNFLINTDIKNNQ